MLEVLAVEKDTSTKTYSNFIQGMKIEVIVKTWLEWNRNKPTIKTIVFSNLKLQFGKIT